MKRVVPVFIFLICTCCALLHGQIRFNAGVHGGFTGNKIPGFSNFGVYKLGLTGGAIINASDGFWNSVQLEINFVHKGASHKRDSVILSNGRIDLSYLEFPLLYQYDDLYMGGLGGTFEIGAAYGILYKRDMTIGSNWVRMDGEHIRNFDISVLMGLGVHLGDHFMLRGRYQLSVLPVLYRNEMPWSTRKIVLFRGHNSGFHVSLVFMLRKTYQ